MANQSAELPFMPGETLCTRSPHKFHISVAVMIVYKYKIHTV